MEKRRKSQTQNEKKVATRKRLNADNKHLQQKKKGKVDSAASAVPNSIRRYILLKKSWEVGESGKITVHGNSFFYFLI